MRRHKKIREEAELNVTSFMNLMIVLVPVLLLNMVFSQLSVLDLRLPAPDQPDAVVDPDDVTLEVTVRKTGFVVARTFREQTEVLATIPASASGPDYDKLSSTLQDIKKNPLFREKTDITLLPEPGTDYQTLVSVMDTVREYPAVIAASLVDAVLFPDISLGDAEEQEVAP